MFEVALDQARLAAHPEHHPRQYRGRDQRHGGKGSQPGVAFELADREVDGHADRDRDQGGGADPRPHRRGQVQSLELAQIGEDDGHDEGGLEAFSHHDEQRGRHWK